MRRYEAHMSVKTPRHWWVTRSRLKFREIQPTGWGEQAPSNAPSAISCLVRPGVRAYNDFDTYASRPRCEGYACSFVHNSDGHTGHPGIVRNDTNHRHLISGRRIDRCMTCYSSSMHSYDSLLVKPVAFPLPPRIAHRDFSVCRYG